MSRLILTGPHAGMFSDLDEPYLVLTWPDPDGTYTRVTYERFEVMGGTLVRSFWVRTGTSYEDALTALCKFAEMGARA